MPQAASSAMGALSSLGSSAMSGLGSLGSAIGSFFGGTPANAAETAGLPSSVPTSLPSPDVGGLGGTSGLPSELPPSYVTPAGTPAPDTSGWSSFTAAPTPDLSLPVAASLNPVGASPASTTEATLQSAVPGYSDPVTGTPFGSMVTPQQAAAATPNATPSIWDQLFGQQGTGGGTAGAVKALGPGGTLGGLGNLVESIMRWNTMRTLANPSALASGASQLYQPMSAAMKRAIINPVTAAAQETGQIGAPGLYSQSVATALAPYQYQMQENALREYIAALEASGQAYPQGGLFGAGGPNYQGGGGYGSVASSS